MRLIVLVVGIIVSNVALAQQVPPETPAARVMQAWLSAFNSADAAQLKAFDEAYQPKRSIAKNGKILLANAWGRADRENNVSATLDTQFRLGSINKMFTAVSAAGIRSRRPE